MIAQFIYRHPRYFALIILCVFAVGMNSLSNIPRQEEPTLTNFAGNITTFYPGATARPSRSAGDQATGG